MPRFVPLAGVLRARAWLWLWAALGVRNRFQRGLGAREVVRLNRDFLLNQTNYLSRRQIETQARPFFARVEFREDLFLKHCGSRRLYPVARRIPLGFAIYSALRTRVLVLDNRTA